MRDFTIQLSPEEEQRQRVIARLHGLNYDDLVAAWRSSQSWYNAQQRRKKKKLGPVIHTCQDGPGFGYGGVTGLLRIIEVDGKLRAVSL